MLRPPPKLALYHFDGCFYCAIVRDAAHELDVQLELRNICEHAAYLHELEAQMGRRTVPVLRIEGADGEVHWMPESRDIVRYLHELVGKPERVPPMFDGVRNALRRAPWLLMVFALLADGRARVGLFVAGLAWLGVSGLMRRRRAAKLRGALALSAALVLLGVALCIGAT